MFELIPNQGVGALRLGMSPDEVAALLGPPTESKDPSSYSFLTPERRAMYKGQLIEKRAKYKDFRLFDVTYLNKRLVVINIKGTASNVHFAGNVLSENRLSLINHCAGLDKDIYVNAETYLFMSLGFIISRPSNRKDINYVMVVDQAFQRARLEFEFYKPHVGPIVP